jgi:hypothetical protein
VVLTLMWIFFIPITLFSQIEEEVLVPSIEGIIKIEGLGEQIEWDKASYPSKNIWLISPKLDFTFTKTLFWTTFVQYNSQGENLGVNSRLQWRFAPLSDLFLVYNDNYISTDNFSPRYRSFNLKFTYWLNI